MIIQEPQCEVHKTTVPHPVTPSETVYATNWGSFPSRQRTHIDTMRARSAIVHRRYAWKEPSSSRPASAASERSDAKEPKAKSNFLDTSVSSTLEQIHRAKMGELPFVAACRRYPLSAQRPMSAGVPKAVISRLVKEQTASSRARSAVGSPGHGVGSRAGGPGGYSWVTLSLYSDSRRAVYDSHGQLKGSKRTSPKC